MQARSGTELFLRGRGRHERRDRMKAGRCLLVVVLALLIPAALASAQELQWTKQFGASGFDVARAMGADETGVYAFGAVSGALPGQTFAGGPDDVYLRKYDQAGNELWTRQFGTSGDDFSMAGPVAIDESAVYVAGWTNGALPGETSAGDYDAFVRRYDTDGKEIWTDQFGGAAYDDIDGVADYRGALFVAGSTLSTLPGQTSGGSWDGYVRRYDSDGNAVWTRQFGTAGNDSASFRGADTDGRGVYVTGNVNGTLPGQTRMGGRDAFVRQYSHDGDELWTIQFGTSGDDRAIAVAIGQNDDVYLGGRTSGVFPGFTYAGGTDAFVTKIVKAE